ncbi:hypothetical protein FRC11_008826, partial [Ceratobasidium sp. 423]
PRRERETDGDDAEADSDDQTAQQGERRTIGIVEPDTRLLSEYARTHERDQTTTTEPARPHAHDQTAKTARTTCARTNAHCRMGRMGAYEQTRRTRTNERNTGVLLLRLPPDDPLTPTSHNPRPGPAATSPLYVRPRRSRDRSQILTPRTRTNGRAGPNGRDRNRPIEPTRTTQRYDATDDPPTNVQLKGPHVYERARPNERVCWGFGSTPSVSHLTCSTLTRPTHLDPGPHPLRRPTSRLLDTPAESAGPRTRDHTANAHERTRTNAYERTCMKEHERMNARERRHTYERTSTITCVPLHGQLAYRRIRTPKQAAFVRTSGAEQVSPNEALAALGTPPHDLLHTDRPRDRPARLATIVYGHTAELVRMNTRKPNADELMGRTRPNPPTRPNEHDRTHTPVLARADAYNKMSTTAGPTCVRMNAHGRILCTRAHESERTNDPRPTEWTAAPNERV